MAAARQPLTQSGQDAPLPADGEKVSRTSGELQLELQAAARPEEEQQEEATPTPPESSSLSSDLETATVATIEEESLSVLLETDRLPDPGRESGIGSAVEGSEGKGQGLRVQVQDFRVQVFKVWSRGQDLDVN